MRGVLFIDRDGVINRMVRYYYGWDSPQKEKDVELVSNIEKVIFWANKNGIPVVEVSNQPGVAKGKMDQKTSDAIEAKVHLLLKYKGVYIDRKHICSHHPKAVVSRLRVICDCRKPKPGLLRQAAQELKIDLKKSIFLGDKASDIKAGRTCGCKTMVFLHKEDEEDKIEELKKIKADFSLLEITESIPIMEGIF